MEPKETAERVAVDQSWKGLYRGGGLSWVLFGVSGIVFLVSSFVGGLFTPTGGQALIQFIAANRAFYTLDETLAFLGQVLVIPGLLGLYFALRGASKNYALVGIAILAAGVVYGMASVTAGLDLVSLSDSYAAATSSSQQAVFVSAAEAVHALDNPPLSNSLISIGLFIISPAVSKSSFGRGLAWLARATGILGLLSFFLGLAFGLNPFIIFFWASSTIFELMLGYKLYRLWLL